MAFGKYTNVAKPKKTPGRPSEGASQPGGQKKSFSGGTPYSPPQTYPTNLNQPGQTMMNHVFPPGLTGSANTVDQTAGKWGQVSQMNNLGPGVEQGGFWRPSNSAFSRPGFGAGDGAGGGDGGDGDGGGPTDVPLNSGNPSYVYPDDQAVARSNQAFANNGATMRESMKPFRSPGASAGAGTQGAAMPSFLQSGVNQVAGQQNQILSDWGENWKYLSDGQLNRWNEFSNRVGEDITADSQDLGLWLSKLQTATNTGSQMLQGLQGQRKQALQGLFGQ